MAKPLFTNDAVVLGILLGILSFVFLTGRSEHLNLYLPMMQLYWVSYWVFYHSYF